MSVLLSVEASAKQIGIISGRVLLRPADAHQAAIPLQGATVDMFNLDSGAKFESQTDGEGHYISVGMEHNSIYLLAISAAHARPAVALKRNSFDLNGDDIILEAGDGKRLTREEALALVEPARLAGMRAFRAGNEALQVKRYDLAIAKFDEAIAALPAEPSFWIYKATAYKMRGFDRFVLSRQIQDTRAKAAQLAAAASDLRAAFEDGKRAVRLVEALTVPTNPGTLQRYRYEKYLALEVRARAGALLADYVDGSLTAEAFAAYQQYLRVESEWHTRAQAQLHAAQILRREYGIERVIAEYRKLNEAEPGNMDVIAILGLALYDSGVRTRFPEAAALLQRFIPYGSDEDHPHPLWLQTRAALESMRR